MFKNDIVAVLMLGAGIVFVISGITNITRRKFKAQSLSRDYFLGLISEKTSQMILLIFAGPLYILGGLIIILLSLKDLID